LPQLDIFSYPTQIFWVLLSLSILYIILTKYVLPDLLYVLRMRSFRTTTLIKFRRSDKMLRFRNVPQRLKALSFLEEAFQTTTSLNKETVRLHAGLSQHFNQQRLGFISLIKSVDPVTSDSNVNQDVSNSLYGFAPFLVFFAPTDEFILSISFLFFFVLFYYFVSPSIVNLMIAPQINELSTYFTKAVDLRKQNLLLKQVKFRNKKSVHAKLFRLLLLYNTLYTSLVLATKENLKLADINEVLSLNKSSGLAFSSNEAQLSFLFQHDNQVDLSFDLLDYNNLRLVYFVCEHINDIQDPFTILDELLND